MLDTVPLTAQVPLAACRPPPRRGVARLTVTQLARAVGVRADTVRYYERVGLLPPPERTPAEHRRYDDSAVDRMRFIQGSQRLGLRLREIRSLLDVRDTGVCPCEPAEDLLRQHVEEVDRELARLTALRAELVAMVEALTGPACPDPAPGTWCPPQAAARFPAPSGRG